MKDIVSESAASYVSVLEVSKKGKNVGEPETGHIRENQEEGEAEVEAKDEKEQNQGEESEETDDSSTDLPTAFSLARFIPLLQERIHVISPFTRMFLVSWLTLLDTIPDLELVHYLPAFLGGLIKFLSDSNRDVHTATQGVLDRFLGEIKKIARIKKGIADSRRERGSIYTKPSAASDSVSTHSERSDKPEPSDNAIADSDSSTANEDVHVYDDWVPGQDVHVDHPRILDILVGFVDTTFGKVMPYH